MSFRLVPKSVTLNDLERPNGVFCVISANFHVRCCRKTINRPTSVSESTYNHIKPICAIIQRLFGQIAVIIGFDRCTLIDC